MGKETEYKLEVGDLQLLDCILCSEPVASRMQAPFAYIRMQTTYYDTEDGLLEKNRWMLRLRTENERSVVTMKTPGEGHTRGEWEVESEYLDEALPELAKLGAPEAIGRLDAEALLPVCGAKFTRITAPLRLSEKTSCTLCGAPPAEPRDEQALRAVLGSRLTKAQILGTIELLETYRNHCEYNVGVGPLLGGLAVELEEIL